MKLGYQDCGSWTLLKSTPVDRRKAAWLFAQFRVAKTTSLKKALVGLTPIRDSDIRDKSFTERAPKLGSLVEFYRSPARVAWTPTGTNVPDYPKLAQLWWQNIGEAVSGEVTVDTAMDNLAREMDRVMERIARSGGQGEYGPKLNPEKPDSYWLNKPGAPKAKLANERPKGETVNCDDLIKAWREGRVK
jgi:glycerol transport system substrate-binding protein